MGAIGEFFHMIGVKSHAISRGEEKKNAGDEAQAAADQIQQQADQYTQAAAKAVAAVEDLKTKKASEDAEVDKWNGRGVTAAKDFGQAQAAKDQARMDSDKQLMQTAAANKAQHQAVSTQYQKAIDAEEAQIAAIKQKVKDLQNHAAQAEGQAQVITGRNDVANAEQQVNGIDSGTKTADQRLQQANDDVTNKEHQNQAINDLTGQTDEQKFQQQAAQQQADVDVNGFLQQAGVATPTPAPAPAPAPSPNAEGNIAK